MENESLRSRPSAVKKQVSAKNEQKKKSRFTSLLVDDDDDDDSTQMDASYREI